MSTHVMSESDQPVADDRDVSVRAFVELSESYFAQVFEKIQRSTLPLWHVNIWGLLVPWLWGAYRGLWLLFWVSLALDAVAVVCLLQVVKYNPLLAEAQANAAENVTLIARYSQWISVYASVGTAILLLGRLWMGMSADRWYYRQYSRWRIDENVSRGLLPKRVVLAVCIMLIVLPLTFYRATQQRLDERACFNQIRAAESAQLLLAHYGASNTSDLVDRIAAAQQKLAAERQGLQAIQDPSSEQKSRLAKIRSEDRKLGRDRGAVEQFNAITARDSFDCYFIDDFPTLARLDPPEDVTYRRVPDKEAIARGEEGATKVLRTVEPPVDGRKVTFFTYVAESTDISINYLRASFSGAFDAMTSVLRQSLIQVEIAFMQTPWPVIAFLFLLLSWKFAGLGTTIFVGASLVFIAIFELWQIAMQTMALVVVSTALCVFVGLPIGVWMAKNKVARWITEPILDVMQTIPSLSYLVPAVAFFGISQPPAVLATVVFAMPPMIKLTALGIIQVPQTTKEAAVAFGASDWQLLREVELPMAVPSMMAGLNQTIMLALSMATISAFIGAEGLGAIVISSLGDAQAGKGLLAGLAIALVAMMIDRILKGIRASFSRI